MAVLKVTLLGEFSVVLDGKPIVDKLNLSKKSSALLKYLFLNYGSAVPAQRIIELFWNDENVSNPESALKTMISRIRDKLAKADPQLTNCIVPDRGAYRWGRQVVCEVDAILFQHLCAQAFSGEPDDALAAGERILLLYAGDIVPISQSGDWLVDTSLYLHGLYLRAMHRYVRLLRERAEDAAIVHTARTVLEIDAFEDAMHLELMTSLRAVGQHSQAIAHFQRTAKMYNKHLGNEPTGELIAYYEELTRAVMAEKDNLQAIRDQLTSGDEIVGAYVCDYSVFQKIHQIQLRNFERLGSQTYLALVTLDVDYRSGEADMIALDKAMEDLLAALVHTLRKGDTVTRYSVNQYAVLLPFAEDGFSPTLASRIKKAYFSRRRVSDRLSIQMLPIGDPGVLSVRAAR